MDSWRKMPKVCKGGAGSANTKRVVGATIYDEGSAMGRLALRGRSLRDAVEARNTDFEPYISGMGDRHAVSGICIVGLELHTTGVRRVRQSYVMSCVTGKPRFYGERW